MLKKREEKYGQKIDWGDVIESDKSTEMNKEDAGDWGLG